MTARRFEYLAEAVEDAAEAFRWYNERSPAAADGFWLELRRARQLVAERPETWNPYLHSTRCFRLNRFPYGLVYIERGDRVIGVAVAHLKRRPGYWRKRLRDAEGGSPETP